MQGFKHTLLFTTFTLIVNVNSVKLEHNYYWREYRGVIPKDAVKGPGNLYIAQVYYEGILPATLYQERKEAVTECRGARRIIKDPIKVLCDRRDDNFAWEHANVNWLNSEYLQDKVTGGYEVGHTLYIGRIFHEGQWKIGKVFPPPYRFKGLTVWYNDGRQYITHDFEILKYLGKPHYDGNCNQVISLFDVRAS